MSSTYKRSSNAEFNVFLQKIADARVQAAELEHSEYPWCIGCQSYHRVGSAFCFWRTDKCRAVYNVITSFWRRTS